MMHTPLTPLTKEHHTEYQVHNTEFKMPSRKEKESLLKRYAKKLGLNDRGCYLAVGLSVIAFLLLLIIIVMAACWPGEKLNINILYQSAVRPLHLIQSSKTNLTCQNGSLNNVF